MNILNIFKHIRKHPKSYYIYAVTKGAFLGELLTYIEDVGDRHAFLSMPSMINREIPKDKFKLGVQEKIVDIVKQIPSGVYKVCKAQYIKNKQK